MPAIFSFEEMPDSRSFQAEPASYTLKYKADGEHDDAIVQAYALAATAVAAFTPAGTLYRQNVQVEPDGWGQYIVTVPYASRKKTTGDYTWSFDTSGATVKIKAAKEHIASYPDDGDWHKGAIGVKADGEVEGVDIVIPALALTVTFNHPSGIVTLDYAKSLAQATGTTNSSTFLGFAAGELLFLGASGSDGSEAPASVSFKLAASQNVTDLSFGDITSIVKQGHHVAWVEFEDDIDTGEAVRPPKRVHIDRVYNSTDFASVFGWS